MLWQCTGKFDWSVIDTDLSGSNDGGIRRQTTASDDLDSGEIPSPIPVSAFAAFQSPQPTAPKAEQEAWLRRRPGATFVEKLQVQCLLRVSSSSTQTLRGVCICFACSGSH